ncbi:MAG TPA: hypothetical protein VFI73_08685 [Candidatus Nitrosopolaris sp.]|nr:hypothetical protein [Candidatus Nitrosopolaris sp.]
MTYFLVILNYYYNYHPIRHFHTPPPTSGKLDKFGIKEIYLSKRGGEEWYIKSYDPKNDPHTGGEPPTTFVQQNNDRSWKVQSTEVRYGVLTSSGYHPDQITTLNQETLAAKDTCNHLMIGRT